MTGINPEMIRLARLSRGFNQTNLAREVGVGQPTYSKMETGTIAVNEPHLSAISAALHYPSSFFHRTERIWGTASPHSRARKALGTLQYQRVEAELNVARLVARSLMVNVAIEPIFDIPLIDIDEVDDAAAAAEEVRRLWRLPSGPIPNMTSLVEDAGIIVIEQAFPSRHLDALSIWGPGEQPLVIMRVDLSADRKRWTLAHEIGHLVLHSHDMSANPEAEANLFASEFLMPAREVRAELQGIRLHQLADMKRRWRVSMRACVHRAQDLDAITRDQARYMYMKLNQTYGPRREPIDLPNEPPSLMRELIDDHIRELGFSISEVAGIVDLMEDEFIQKYLPGRHLRAL